MRIAALLLVLSMPSFAAAQQVKTAQQLSTDEVKGSRPDLIFQTGKGWSPRVNVESQVVMVYGIDATMPERIASWCEHGYRVAVMTGVAWGEYGDYLRGDFDGKEHWNETQQEKSGKLIQHSGREVPYVSPTESYGKYLSQGVKRALNAGAEAIYLEEPEFWARAGWSEAFKSEWQAYYHEAWQAPDSSPDAQYRASKLKYFLYRRALSQVFTFVKEWGEAHGKRVPCYVATHSLINYAHWQIVSPESSLLDVGADGYIAQVWTGTSREPNVYEGKKESRTFETAFLEYGALQNIARSSGKQIWYLNDPIEDNPNHSWIDYKRNWESTLVASLLQPQVASYEILPWPDRIFGPKSTHPIDEPTEANPKPERRAISAEYETELQTVFHALGEMRQAKTYWQQAGTQGIGVLASDTMMFQRGQPDQSDANLGSFYGLALPLLMRGMPVEPVQIESTYRNEAPTGSKNAGADFLKNYKLLLLTYEGQKPPSPKFHEAIATWVKAGGALVVVDDDKDPYNKASDWWNSGERHMATPREDLFRVLGLKAQAEGEFRVGRGVVIYAKKSPAALTYEGDGAEEIRQLVHKAADTIHLPWKESYALVLRRGPFLIASGLDLAQTSDEKTRTTKLTGTYVDLFDSRLGILKNPEVKAGQRQLLVDPSFFMKDKPCVIAASAKIVDVKSDAHSISFSASSIEGRDAEGDGIHDLTSVRLKLPKEPKKTTIDGVEFATDKIVYQDGMALLEFAARAREQVIRVEF